MTLLRLSFVLLISLCACEQQTESPQSEPDMPAPPATEERCTVSSECGIGEYCDECAGGASCPTCNDCIGLCTPSSCETEAQAACEVEAPTCEYGSVLVVQNECWLCVDQNTCEETPEIPPEISCITANDCPAGSICDECAGSSCPTCDDCYSACLPLCESEASAVCEIDPPTCGEDQVRVITDGCWECVSQATCTP